MIGGDEKGTESLLNELIEEGALQGRYQSNYYIPDRFSTNQKRMVTQFL
jgi:hypothetical protein